MKSVIETSGFELCVAFVPILALSYLFASYPPADGSRRLWEAVLGAVEKWFGSNSDFCLIVFGTFALHLVTFWSHCLALMALDVNNHSARLKSILQWKIQKQENVPISSEKLAPCIKQCLFNQFVVNLSLSLASYPLFVLRGCPTSSLALPSIYLILRDLFWFIVIEEIGFYYMHRLFHHPFLYKRFHKLHHEFTAPVGYAAIYAHPLEHVLANLTPVVAGPLLMRSHIVTYWLWLTLAVFSTVTSHSGYHFPFLPSPEFHDYHHLKFEGNYGVLGILDHLHGTDVRFQDTAESARNKVFFSFSLAAHHMSEKGKGKEKQKSKSS